MKMLLLLPEKKKPRKSHSGDDRKAFSGVKIQKAAGPDGIQGFLGFFKI